MSAAPSIDAYLAAFDGGPGRAQPEAEVARVVREYLAAAQAHLRELHEAEASGAQVGEANADLIDRLMRRLFGYAEEGYFADAGGDPSPLTVVAVGGYARREMNVHSDVDLLFLYRGELTSHVSQVAERILYWLWDASVTVGGATRTLRETLDLARDDATVRTAVLDPRYLAGSGVLFHEFGKALRAELLRDPARFIAEQLEAMRKRHTRFGDTLYLLQPNLKDGPGGLRDYHLATWAMQATQPGARGFESFLHLGLLTEAELATYREAVDFLWRARNELHLATRRKHDQMSFELQERIALRFGYGKAGNGGAELPVERFMRDYYRHARAIQNHSSLVIEQCQARVHPSPRRRRIREVEHGFRIVEGQLEIPQARQLREEPLLLLEAFAVAQERDAPLTRKARRLIQQNLELIDAGFQASPAARDVFLRILSARKRVMRSLIVMNETGLLGRFLPEWEHIVCRWQHVMYHTFTVDVHSIFLIEELRRLWLGEYEQRFPELTELMHGIDDRPVLFFGCLLHDIGKGLGGDHSVLGAARARVCLERLGIEPERVDRVVFLVLHHLLMSHLAQRRDLSDPKLIVDFARTVGDRTNLRNLYLLTFADIRASSATGWTDWKGQLLRELFERTGELLESGRDDPGAAIEIIERRVETRRAAAAAELRGLGVSQAHIEAYFEMMPRRYFTAHAPAQIARHARVVLGRGPGQLFGTAVREMRGGFSEFILCTGDAPGLYSRVAGTLAARGINILAAHVYTTRTGLALEVYRLATPEGGEDERGLAWQELEQTLQRVLSGQEDVAELLKRRRLPVGGPRILSDRPARVGASNEESDLYTIVDVAANDRLGLLHDLTRVISDQGYEVYISKAATIEDQVTDTFYLKDRQGKKIQDPEALERLRGALLEAARAGEAPAGG